MNILFIMFIFNADCSLLTALTPIGAKNRDINFVIKIVTAII